MTTALESLLRARTGPMTDDLVLHPGEFGLGRIPARLKPAATTNSVCGFCSTGCSLKIHLNERGEALNLSANPDYPVNLGMACPKGWEALTPLRAPDRATTPLLRNEQGELEPVDWERALLVFSGKFKEIQQRFGNDSVAYISTGQIVTEEMALLGALAKFGMGIKHGDGNTRQCMATSVVAYKQSFGFDAPPYTYADFEESDVIVLWGSNLCIAHPIMWQRVMRNRHSPGIIVIDPRVTETAQAATQHVALRPKSDLTLAYGLAHLLIARGAIKPEYIAAHTSGFAEFEKFVAEFTPGRVAGETGLAPEVLEALAAAIAAGKRVSFWWTMGVNQGHEATRTAQAIINLALMTGNMGRPGTGANSITGQCNAMGSRLFSNTTNLLGGHDFTNAAHREKIASVLGIPETTIPRENSLAYDQILDGIAEGKIRGLWVIATNTAHSWMSQGRARDLLASLDFLVVQDMYSTTETAQAAHLVLPAAGWGEKEGTFINSERRIGRAQKVARAPGQALSDFKIFQLIAHYWGCGAMFARWSSPETAFQILKQLSRGQPCDISGIRDYAHLEQAGGIQWPWPKSTGETGSQHPLGDNTPAIAERRLFADGKFFTTDGRAKFIFEAPRPAPEPPDAEFPFVLLTGRGTSSQWHTQTRTAKSAVLRKLYPEKIYAEVNPADATRLGLSAGDAVVIRSRRGSLTAAAFITATVQPGQVFLPMHYAETNQLTHWSVDPYSRQPSYKACAVSLSLSDR
ncbi:MAG TPA: nitrate reductase [Opitutaceae bacterium]|nr:nitrate reductase [Opitutaceae bacterium]